MKKAFLGIDVSKGYADFALIGQDFKYLTDPVQFDDTREGYRICGSWLEGCIKETGITQIRAAVESTGGLENNWLAGFKTILPQVDIKLIRLNPATVKFASKASLSTVTTDGQSARNIALYLGRYSESLDFNALENPYLAEKKITMQLQHFTKLCSAAKNVFRQMIYEVFPEIQSFCPKNLPNWLFELLQKYPTPKKIASVRPSALAKIRGLTLEKAERLIKAANNSAGSALSASDEMLIKGQIRQIEYQQQEIQRLKTYLQKEVKGPEIELLKSIPGIGSNSAAVLMIHIGAIHRFASAQKLASFFGVTPLIRQSGDKKGVSCMSKKGSSLVRATLYMCASSAVIHDAHLKEIYAGHRSKGKSHKQAIGVIMHKLLRMVWGILTSRIPFDAKIDKNNQETAITSEKSQEFEINKKRSAQSFDPMAPVSNRTRKQRKEHLLSQAIVDGQMRDLESTPLKVKT